MGLLEKMRDESVRDAAVKCTVGALLDHPEYGDEVQQALDAHPDITYEGMSRGLYDYGIEIAGGTLARHNRHRCKCPRPVINV